MRPLAISVFVLLLATLCPGGVIVTSDGRRVEGDLKRVADGWDVTRADGTIAHVLNGEVRSIEITSSTSNVSDMERLASLRRSVEFSDDLAKIVERYERLLTQIKTEDVLAEAKKDLAIWHERLEQGLIRVGKQWVTAEQKRAMAAQILQQVANVRELMKQGRPAEARRAVDTMLQQDPDNISAIYLDAVLLVQADRLPDARKRFTLVQQALPDHAPTLCNLAVILARQKQWGPACAMMDQSMVAAPNVEVLIDNAAELLELVPEDQRKGSAAQKLAHRFFDQDAAMQKAMSGKQKYRWGATWVDKAAFDKLQQVDIDIKKRVTDLQAEFDTTQARIRRIDDDMDINQQALRDMERRSYVMAADGTYIRVPLPPAYYDIQRDIARLKGDRKEMVARLDTLRESAKHVTAAYPVPKFTGMMRTIDEDGVPVFLPDPAPATAPADPATTQSTTPPPATQSSPPPIIRIGPSFDAQ